MLGVGNAPLVAHELAGWFGALLELVRLAAAAPPVAALDPSSDGHAATNNHHTPPACWQEHPPSGQRPTSKLAVRWSRARPTRVEPKVPLTLAGRAPGSVICHLWGEMLWQQRGLERFPRLHIAGRRFQ